MDHGGCCQLNPPISSRKTPILSSYFIPAAILRYRCDNNPQQVEVVIAFRVSRYAIVGFSLDTWIVSWNKHFKPSILNLGIVVFTFYIHVLVMLYTNIHYIIIIYTYVYLYIYIYQQVYIPQRIKNLQRYMKRKGVESFCFTHLVCSKGSSRP